MDQSLEEFNAEYDRLNDALTTYCIDFGPNMSEPERVFSEMMYYWCAALDNNNDVFGYVPFIIEHKADFATIGATRTLQALEKLLPYYREQEKLQSQQEKGEYWWRTREERAPGEAHAERLIEFGRLLLAYAESNLSLP